LGGLPPSLVLVRGRMGFGPELERRWRMRETGPHFRNGSTNARASGRSRRAARHSFSLRSLSIERLERRNMLSAVNWTGNGGDMSWSNPLNWSTDALPGAADDVTINVASPITITHASGSDTVHTLDTTRRRHHQRCNHDHSRLRQRHRPLADHLKPGRSQPHRRQPHHSIEFDDRWPLHERRFARSRWGQSCPCQTE
jgi:hypothetical protein